MAEEELIEREYKVEVNGRLHAVRVIGRRRRRGRRQPAGARKAPQARAQGRRRRPGSSEALVSPLQGTVLKVAVAEGVEVAEGDLVCVIEAMKMENEITAHRAGKVTALAVAEGAAVAAGDLLAKIE